MSNMMKFTTVDQLKQKYRDLSATHRVTIWTWGQWLIWKSGLIFDFSSQVKVWSLSNIISKIFKCIINDQLVTEADGCAEGILVDAK